MNEDQTLAHYLNKINASHDVVQQGLRYYLAEQTDDLPPEDMRELLSAESLDTSEVDIQIASLMQSSRHLEEAALVYLAAAWDDPDERESVRAALLAANKSLPVIEGVVIATVAMYALYLLATRGKAKETKIIQHNPDGSFKESVETVYASPAPWLQNVFGLFSPGQSKADSGT